MHAAMEGGEGGGTLRKNTSRPKRSPADRSCVVEVEEEEEDDEDDDEACAVKDAGRGVVDATIGVNEKR